jgi:hypothetical protein
MERLAACYMLRIAYFCASVETGADHATEFFVQALARYRAVAYVASSKTNLPVCSSVARG